MGLFTIVLFHAGKFEGIERNEYIRQKTWAKQFNDDMISYWCLVDVLKDLGYQEMDIKNIFYGVPEMCLSRGLHVINDGKSIKDMIVHAWTHGNIEIYVEHNDEAVNANVNEYLEEDKIEIDDGVDIDVECDKELSR